MRLDHLHLLNFRCYEDAHFDFQPGFNLVVGVNGSGKTSLLRGVASCFLPVGNFLERAEHSLLFEDIRSVIDKYENRIRHERRYPIFVRGEGDIFGLASWQFMSLDSRYKAGVSPNFQPHMEGILERLNSGEEVTLPVLAFYRAERHWISSSISTEAAVKNQVSRLDSYRNWNDAVVDVRNFESWIIEKTLERLQDHLDAIAFKAPDDELEWTNQAVGIAIPDARNLRYDLRLKKIVVDMGSEKTLLFQELSDGQRSLIAIVADIARRMCILNPHLGKNVLKETDGVIIIDELDIHLHPSWQRNIAPALKRAFPKIQFIASSHSPQVIGSLLPEEVILLQDGGTSHPRATYGLDSSSILEAVMGVTQRDPEIESLLNELFSTLEDNHLEKARQQLAALKKKAPDLPEFAGAEALIRRKEMLGR